MGHRCAVGVGRAGERRGEGYRVGFQVEQRGVAGPCHGDHVAAEGSVRHSHLAGNHVDPYGQRAGHRRAAAENGCSAAGSHRRRHDCVRVRYCGGHSGCGIVVTHQHGIGERRADESWVKDTWGNAQMGEQGIVGFHGADVAGNPFGTAEAALVGGRATIVAACIDRRRTGGQRHRPGGTVVVL